MVSWQQGLRRGLRNSTARHVGRRHFGLLKVGEPLSWADSIEHCKYIREHGLRQFIATYNRVKDLANDRLFYGDEIEHAVLKLDEGKTIKLSLRADEIREELNKRESNIALPGDGCTWHQEYGSWMLEGTPAMPYGAYTLSLLSMEYNMRLRRARLSSVLKPDEIAPTVVNFPLMGMGDFVDPPALPGGKHSESDSVPDSVINPHPRFGTLTGNIRQRRGSKVNIQIPLFEDTSTDMSQPFIHMDCMAYGMGCCCLQLTFQASDIDESRYLYDQLAPLTPVMLALTAATPIFRGRLANVDVRWSTISGSVDDRTPAERGEHDQPGDSRLAGDGVRPLHKSRYDSISRYLQTDSKLMNDVPCPREDDFRIMLLNEGVDATLANHLSHLFVRDPLVVFEGSVQEVDDNISTEHFESINSTNWQSVRWKPPPPQSAGKPHIGWRVEFRTMELQLTDFENAAFCAFIVLITRALLVFDLDMRIPISKVDENMRRAHVVDARGTQKFWFSDDVVPSGRERDKSGEMTLGEIMGGTGNGFPGLVPLCYAYLEHIQCDAKSYARIDQYLTFIQKRADGELLTPAAWMRKFVRAHPDYKNDSVVNQSIAYDLMKACDDVGKGKLAVPELHGDVEIQPIMTDGLYGTTLEGGSSQTARSKILQQLAARALKQDGPQSRPSAPRACRKAEGDDGD